MISKSIDNTSFLSLSSIAGGESMNQYKMQDFDTDSDNDNDNDDIIDLEEQKAPSSKLKLKLEEEEKHPATTSSSEKINHYSFMGPTTDDGDEEPKRIKVNIKRSSKRSSNSNSNNNNNNNNGSYKDGGVMSSMDSSPTKNILTAPRLTTDKDQSLSTKKMQGTLTTNNIDNHNHNHNHNYNNSDSTPVDHPTKNKNKDGSNNHIGQQQPQQRMTRKELLIATITFGIVLIAAVTTTFVAMTISTKPKVVIGGGNLHKNNNNNEDSGNGDNNRDTTLSSTMTSSPTLPLEMKLSIEEEWMLVYTALQENEITRELLLVISDDVDIEIDDYKYDDNGFELSNDTSFYEELISGLVFSETERDWIPAAVVQVEDNTMMSMSNSKSGNSSAGSGSEGRIFGIIDDDNDIVANINNWNPPRDNDNKNNKMITTTTMMTPNQKATAWLLFHDEIKDPNESLWRWAIASIYYKMNGQYWKNMNFEYWFNSNTSLCKWERLNSGSNNYNNNCGGGGRGSGNGSGGDNKLQLPTEIDFDGLNIIGEIPIEFALLGGTTALSSTTSSLRSIMLTDNKLYGTIPGRVFEQLRPSLGKLYLDHNQFTGTVPLELGGMDTLYVQNNLLTGDWPEPFCYDGDEFVNNFGLDCDMVECLCCASMNCYYLK